MNPPSVLYVITDLKTGGVPLHLARLATHAQQCGHRVAVCGLAPPGPVSEMLNAAGIATSALGAAGPWDWRVFERLAECVREVRPDVVHALLFHANVASRAACVLSGFPVRRLVCEIQTVETERPWHLRIEGWLQRWCHSIIGNSPSVIEHLHCAGRIARKRLRLIQGGVNLSPAERPTPVDRGDLGIDNDDPVLLWVGRLDPVKGLDELIPAFDRVMASSPCNLLLAGEGDYRHQVERLIAVASSRERIFMLGSRSDVPALLGTADLFVFPSRTEGMPNALLEAMAAGLPCVATNVAGCRDVIANGVDGLLTSPGDPAALADTVLRILGDTSLSQRLGEAAAETVRTRFPLERCLKSYLALYDEIVAD